MALKQGRKIMVLIFAISAILFLISPGAAEHNIQASSKIILAKGDPLIITGDGFMNGSVMIWGIGPSFIEKRLIKTSPEGNLFWEWTPEITENFRSGPFIIIIQDPGKDGEYSISSTEVVYKNYRIESTDGNHILDVIPEKIDLPASYRLAKDLGELISGSGSDDSLLLHEIYVEEPSLHLSEECRKIMTVPSGKNIQLKGTMNMATENRIVARIYDISTIENSGRFIPVKSADFIATKNGNWKNYWEYSLDTSDLSSGEYLVNIGWEREPASGQNSIIIQVVEK